MVLTLPDPSYVYDTPLDHDSIVFVAARAVISTDATRPSVASNRARAGVVDTTMVEALRSGCTPAIAASDGITASASNSARSVIVYGAQSGQLVDATPCSATKQRRTNNTRLTARLLRYRPPRPAAARSAARSP